MATPELVERLAAAIWRGLDRDAWGAIDPYLFRYVGEGATGDAEDMEEETREGVKSLRAILTLALNETMSPPSRKKT